MAKTMELESTPINIITDGAYVKGDVTATGDFRLDGTLEGSMQLNGKLVVGDSGKVIGNVVCQNANIIGSVEGNLTVKELLSLHASSRVKGDIIANRLSIEPGAVFSGRCRMLDEVNAEQAAQAKQQAEAKK